MSEQILAFIIVICCAVLPCLIFGYLIAYQGRRSLISGWSDDKVSNPQLCGKLIGDSLMLMALLLAVITALWMINIVNEIIFTFGICVVTLIPIFALIFTKIKYGK